MKTLVKFLPVGTKGFQATLLQGTTETGLVKTKVEEVSVTEEGTRNVFLHEKTNILIMTDKGMFKELYPTEKDAWDETNPIPMQEIELDVPNLGDVVFVENKGLTTIDMIFINFDGEKAKLSYSGYSSTEGFYFKENEIIDKKMFFFKSGIRKMTGKYIEDHVNINAENQVEKLFEAVDIEGHIERAKTLLLKGEEAKAYAEASLNKISYISSLKKEQDKLIQKIEKEEKNNLYFQKMIETLSSFNQQDSVLKKLKILVDLKLVRLG